MEIVHRVNSLNCVCSFMNFRHSAVKVLLVISINVQYYRGWMRNTAAKSEAKNPIAGLLALAKTDHHAIAQIFTTTLISVVFRYRLLIWNLEENCVWFRSKIVFARFSLATLHFQKQETTPHIKTWGGKTICWHVYGLIRLNSHWCSKILIRSLPWNHRQLE